MARKKIIWTDAARSELYQILDFFIQRNNSTSYSAKLFKEIQHTLKVLSRYPFLGKPTDIPNVRMIVLKEYQIYYIIENGNLVVLMIWDCRQNPEKPEI